VVDDEEPIRVALTSLLSGQGHEVETAEDLASARRLLAHAPAILLLDLWLPDGNGLDLLRELRERNPGVAVIMISGRADIATAVRALKEGAQDFLEKPLAPERVLVAVRNALRLQELERENRGLRESIGLEGPFVARSRVMEEVLQQVRRAAESQAPVLLQGESGTGKERLARLLHEGSPRRHGPFVAVNTAAIPKELLASELFGHERGAFTGATGPRRGRFLQADGGTLFLDEIGDMPEALQVALLRVVETARVEPLGRQQPVPVDVRLVSATHRDLAREVEAGRFRLDLYYRLAVVVIRIPPLRERPEDIPVLAQHFLEVLGRLHGLGPCELSPEAERVLCSYPWPGNVRELRNVLERVLILGRPRRLEAEPLRSVLAQNPAGPAGSAAPTPSPSLPYREAFRQWERGFLESVLLQEGWNVARAAARLGWDRTHLHRKIRQHGLRRRTPGEEEEPQV
jgi:DNA-binding NtrC family response regulator